MLSPQMRRLNVYLIESWMIAKIIPSLVIVLNNLMVQSIVKNLLIIKTGRVSRNIYVVG